MMVFKLGWDAARVQDMTVGEIAHWCNRAIAFYQSKGGRS